MPYHSETPTNSWSQGQWNYARWLITIPLFPQLQAAEHRARYRLLGRRAQPWQLNSSSTWAALSPHLWIMMWNKYRLNTPRKRQCNPHNPKQKSTMWFIINTFISKDIYELQVKGQNKIFHANGTQEKSGVAILIEKEIRIWYKATRTQRINHFTVL